MKRTRVTPSKEINFFRIALFPFFFSIFTHVYFIGGISWRNLLLFLLPINRHKTMVVYNECNRSIYFNQKPLKYCHASNLFSVIFTVFKTATIAKPYYNQIHWLHRGHLKTKEEKHEKRFKNNKTYILDDS